MQMDKLSPFFLSQARRREAEEEAGTDEEEVRKHFKKRKNAANLKKEKISSLEKNKQRLCQCTTYCHMNPVRDVGGHQRHGPIALGCGGLNLLRQNSSVV